uniref:Presenilin n=1 Tax=Palpitomonas bilix TaxID=652834 RepID=A0A7S3G0Q4_9EUKA|mmetsp:Transcript_19392/g.49710  ORF Transcript_19392/g.49710 Transcript_19392/m.49710 type:complete len:564 (+) Transcript_19392:136-1827(+)
MNVHSELTLPEGVVKGKTAGKKKGEEEKKQQKAGGDDVENPRQRGEGEEEEEMSESSSVTPTPEERIKYTAGHITNILRPVSLTMLLVVFVVRLLTTFDEEGVAQSDGRSYYFLVYQEQSTDSTEEKIGGALLNALLFVGIVLVMTVVLVILYKYRCIKVIIGWLCVTVALLLGFSGGFMVYTFFYNYNIRADVISLSLFQYNFAVAGVVGVFWKGPLKFKQVYMVIVSVVMAWVFSMLPEWTNWAILFALALYDIIAVLAPCGPLKALVKMSQQRNEPIPALVYESEGVKQEERGEERTSRGGGGARVEVEMSEVKKGDKQKGDRVKAERGGSARVAASPPSSMDGDGRERAESKEERGKGNEWERQERGRALSASTPSPVNLSEDEVDSDEVLQRNLLGEKVDSAGQSRQGGGAGEGGKGVKEGREKESGERRRDSVPHPADVEVVGEELEEEEEEEEEEENSGVKLGLGDFVFYSVLVARAALFDLPTVVACFIAILAGLCITILLLAAFKKALPALPFSIAFGIIFYVMMKFAVLAFVVEGGMVAYISPISAPALSVPL